MRRRRPATYAFWACLGLLLGTIAGPACGKKASPIRPERLVPKPVRNLEAFNDARGIRVSWRAPDKRVNNQPVEALASFVILRTSGETKAQCTMTGNPWVRVADVSAEGFQENKNKLFRYLDRDVRVGKWYSYRVLAVEPGGEFSRNPSGDSVILRGKPPAKAPALSPAPGDGFVSLRMPEFPGDVAGWFLYRVTEAVTDEPLFPYSKGLVTGQEYTDAGLVNGVPYRYAASWVRFQEGFPVEGRRSEWVRAAAHDLVPPPAPQSLVGVARGGEVDLRWERVDEAGVGYHVYRRLQDERRLTRVTETPLTDNTFLDRPVPGAYVYRVSSVDPEGNESSMGGQTTVTVR